METKTSELNALQPKDIESRVILIVEDEPKLASILSDYLVQSGFRTYILDNGLDVNEWVSSVNPDLILLDLMLPGKDGLQVCREIRSYSEIPIIMTTARLEEIDRLLGLELGADDYVCKPFSYREIVARVKAILRRSTWQKKATDQFRTGLPPGIKLDQEKYQASINGNPLALTAVEFNLFAVMVREPGRIFNRNQLMESIYNQYRIVSDRTIDSHIKKLRKKIKEVVQDRDLIQSVYGVGYKFQG
ncbi:response regulator [Oleiphilus messinensis]|uniref:response regulator n=1 Tax=Oleiphilus messinensis TaxID=141451 RepID=UPI001E2D19BE|nr:response regulator [Oleiphilus messinensis]